MVRAIVTEGPARIQELLEMGVQFDEREMEDGERELDLGREGGHSKRRVLHARDVTGREIERALLADIERHPNITMLENHMGVDLITAGKLGYATEDRCLGVYVLDEATGEVEAIRSDRMILATGGCGKVTSTPPIPAWPRAMASAWHGAPARISRTWSSSSFIPPAFTTRRSGHSSSPKPSGGGGHPARCARPALHGRLSPAQGAGPRDIVARAIDAEMKRSGERHVLLDITHKPADFVRDRFPNIYQTCLDLGIDITKEPIPVVPAAHYQCGGVQTDVDGRTSLRGLYAIGEVACTGLHGANRLASNSLLEAAVLGHRAAVDIVKRIPVGKDALDVAIPEWRIGDAMDVDERVVISHNWEEIRRLMWDYVGIVRTDKRLQRASTRLRNLQREIQEFYWHYKITTDLLELRNLATVAALIVDCALARKESRGLHYTLDYPDRDDRNFLRNTVLHRL